MSADGDAVGTVDAARPDRGWWVGPAAAAVVMALAIPLLASISLVNAFLVFAVMLGESPGCAPDVCPGPTMADFAAPLALLLGPIAAFLVALVLLVASLRAPYTIDRRTRRWAYSLGSIACLVLLPVAYFWLVNR